MSRCRRATFHYFNRNDSICLIGWGPYLPTSALAQRRAQRPSAKRAALLRWRRYQASNERRHAQMPAYALLALLQIALAARRVRVLQDEFSWPMMIVMHG